MEQIANLIALLVNLFISLVCCFGLPVGILVAIIYQIDRKANLSVSGQRNQVIGQNPSPGNFINVETSTGAAQNTWRSLKQSGSSSNMAIRITGEISESELVPSTKVEGIHIVLKAPGANKALVIQYIAEAIGGDMKQAQQWVGKAPLILPIPFSGMEEAQVLAEKLAIAGAGISVNL